MILDKEKGKMGWIIWIKSLLNVVCAVQKKEEEGQQMYQSNATQQFELMYFQRLGPSPSWDEMRYKKDGAPVALPPDTKYVVCIAALLL